MEDIPQEWVKNYIDVLLGVAQQLPDGVFKDAVLLRVDHVMDLVKAFRDRKMVPVRGIEPPKSRA